MGNKKRAICLATLLQNELNSDVGRFTTHIKPVLQQTSGAPNDNFRKNICSKGDLRSRIFGKFVVKFLVCLPLLGFSNI